MATVAKWPKDQYLVDLPSNEKQEKFIDKGKTIPHYSERGFQVGSLTKEQHRRLVQQYKRATYITECEDYDHLEDEAIIRATDKSVWPVSTVCIDREYFQRFFKSLTPLIMEWSKENVKEEVIYGPRIYRRGAVLLNHVDKYKTHLLSITTTLDYNIEYPWPIVLTLDDETIAEVNLEPGDYLLYEGARLAHCRPSPLQGEYYANMYFHWSVVR